MTDVRTTHVHEEDEEMDVEQDVDDAERLLSSLTPKQRTLDTDKTDDDRLFPGNKESDHENADDDSSDDGEMPVYESQRSDVEMQPRKHSREQRKIITI